MTEEVSALHGSHLWHVHARRGVLNAVLARVRPPDPLCLCDSPG